MTTAELEAAADAVSVLNNITHATVAEILDALMGPVFSETEAGQIAKILWSDEPRNKEKLGNGPE